MVLAPRPLRNPLSRSVLLLSALLACLGLPRTSAGERTARMTLMALGDNRVADLDALPHRYDLMIASADVRPDVLTAFRTGKPGLQQCVAGLVVETLKMGRYDGIQLDDVSTEFPFRAELVWKWISGVPVKR